MAKPLAAPPPALIPHHRSSKSKHGDVDLFYTSQQPLEVRGEASPEVPAVLSPEQACASQQLLKLEDAVDEPCNSSGSETDRLLHNPSSSEHDSSYLGFKRRSHDSQHQHHQHRVPVDLQVHGLIKHASGALRITGYAPDYIKVFLYYFVCIIAAGLFPIVCSWF